MCSHKVEEGLRGRAVMMLATLGRDWDRAGAMVEGGNGGRVVFVRAAAGLGGEGGAGVIPSISPSCSEAALEPSSALSPGAGAVDWRARLRVVPMGCAGWP